MSIFDAMKPAFMIRVYNVAWAGHPKEPNLLVAMVVTLENGGFTELLRWLWAFIKEKFLH